MTEPLLKALIRKDVDVRLQNMVAVQMEKQNLKERNLKDAKKCLSRLEVNYWHTVCCYICDSKESTHNLNG
jgi:hypothetical protein